MKISTVRNKILTCHHENLDRSWQNLDLSLWKSPLVIIRINFNFWPRQCSAGYLVYCCSGFKFSVWEKNIFSSLSHICHFFLRISTCFGKSFKPFPIRRNFTLSTTQNKGRFGFMSFQTFGAKAIKSSEETEVLIAMLSKESMAKISFNLEDKYLWKALNSQ